MELATEWKRQTTIKETNKPNTFISVSRWTLWDAEYQGGYFKSSQQERPF